jgi:hypothetical protein
MAKVSHKQRIIDLIEFNKSDVEIKKTIYNEYNIVVKLSDIEAKRNTNYIIEFKENKNQEIDDKIKLVKEILNDNYYNPLTKKDIVNKIYAEQNVCVTQIEIKEILWTKLRNEIVYDKNEWTYRLRKNNDLQKLDNNIDEYTSIIDGYTIIVKIVEREFDPLYWSKTEGLKQFIYYNKLHPKAEILIESNFVQLLVALGRTSLSFSDNSGEIFFNRLKNYIDLIK